MFNIVNGKVIHFTEKTEKISLKQLTVNPKHGGDYHLFNQNPTFRRKHYSQLYREEGENKINKIQSIVLSYDVGKKMGDDFFKNFLPDLISSIDKTINGAALLKNPQHTGLFSLITRGKYLTHWIDGRPDSELAYTYNLELNRPGLININQQILDFENVDVDTSLGEGKFKFSDVSISYRPNSPKKKEDEFNFSFKFTFHNSLDEKITSKFKNDNHNTFSAVINIHFSRIKGNKQGIKSTASLISFLENTLKEFNLCIKDELNKSTMLDLRHEQLNEVPSIGDSNLMTYYTPYTRHLVHYAPPPRKDSNISSQPAKEFIIEDKDFPSYTTKVSTRNVTR